MQVPRLIAAHVAGKSQEMDASTTACAWGCAHRTSLRFCSLRPAQTSWRWSIQSPGDGNEQHLQALGGQSYKQGQPRHPAIQKKQHWAGVRALHPVPAGRLCCDSLGQITQIPRLFISSIIKCGGEKEKILSFLSPAIIQLNTFCTQQSLLQMPSSIETGMSFNIRKAGVQICFLYSFNSPIILWPSINFLECTKEFLIFKNIIQCILCCWYFLITLFGNISRNGILP